MRKGMRAGEIVRLSGKSSFCRGVAIGPHPSKERHSVVQWDSGVMSVHQNKDLIVLIKKENTMIKFDLERALRGDELITRGGGLVTGFVSRGWYLNRTYPYKTDNWTIYTNTGSFYGTSEDSKDLFMKYEDKKTMDTFTTFTKSDLKTGMFVRYRNGEYRLVIGDNFTGTTGFNPLFHYKDNLLATNGQDSEFDIVSVYKVAAKININAYFRGDYLTLLWERTQQTEAQKEMESLNKKIAELQEQATRLQDKI